MKKSLLGIFFIMCFMMPYNQMAAQENKKTETVQNDQSAVVLAVSSDTIHIQKATPGTVMEIYNILGVKINSFVIDTSEKTISLSLPKGYYIFKIGSVVRKVVVK